MIRVREAGPGDRAAVAGILDGAALAVDHGTLPAKLAGGSVLLAHEADRALGALTMADDPAPTPPREAALAPPGDVADGATARIEAVAVRPRRRGQGIGTALVQAAADRWDRLVASCDDGVRPFYAALGFEVTPLGDDRYRAVLPPDRRPGGDHGDHGD